MKQIADRRTLGRMEESPRRNHPGCTILTATPNTLLAGIHDRMPVIVTPDKYDLWLNPEVGDFDAVREILKPYNPSLMRHYPVSPRVNSVQNDDVDCAAPITLELPEQARLF